MFIYTIKKIKKAIFFVSIVVVTKIVTSIEYRRVLLIQTDWYRRLFELVNCSD